MKLTDLLKAFDRCIPSLEVRFEWLKQPLFSKLNIYWEDDMEEKACFNGCQN